MSQRISPFLGQRSRKVGKVLGDTLQIDNCFLFVNATCRSGDMPCRVQKSRKNGPKFNVFVPHIWGKGQVWLRSHGWSFIYADEIKK